MQLGLAIPGNIHKCIEDIKVALEQCMPYQDMDHEDNEYLMDVAVSKAKKIIRNTIKMRNAYRKIDETEALLVQHKALAKIIKRDIKSSQEVDV